MSLFCVHRGPRKLLSVLLGNWSVFGIGTFPRPPCDLAKAPNTQKPPRLLLFDEPKCMLPGQCLESVLLPGAHGSDLGSLVCIEGPPGSWKCELLPELGAETPRQHLLSPSVCCELSLGVLRKCPSRSLLWSPEALCAS